MQILAQESPRLAILGAGGMGKTSLARAVLHHPEAIALYDHRIFVACDSATTSVEIADRIAMHLGLKPGTDRTTPVVQCCSKLGPCLLILDNLETPWEPKESRAAVEEFLSRLTDAPQLALLVTIHSCLVDEN
jgi:GTPase SAR1 family protein